MRGERHRGECAEEAVAQAFEKEGLTVLRKGWPNLLIVGENRIAALEVKIGRRARLSDAQKTMHRALNAAGLPTNVLHHYGYQATLMPTEVEEILQITYELGGGRR